VAENRRIAGGTSSKNVNGSNPKVALADVGGGKKMEVWLSIALQEIKRGVASAHTLACPICSIRQPTRRRERSDAKTSEASRLRMLWPHGRRNRDRLRCPLKRLSTACAWPLRPFLLSPTRRLLLSLRQKLIKTELLSKRRVSSSLAQEHRIIFEPTVLLAAAVIQRRWANGSPRMALIRGKTLHGNRRGAETRILSISLGHRHL